MQLGTTDFDQIGQAADTRTYWQKLKDMVVTETWALIDAGVQKAEAALETAVWVVDKIGAGVRYVGNAFAEGLNTLIDIASIEGVQYLKGQYNIWLNTFTFGYGDEWGWTDTDQFQGWGWGTAKITTGIARDSVIAIGTAGAGNALVAGGRGIAATNGLKAVVWGGRAYEVYGVAQNSKAAVEQYKEGNKGWAALNAAGAVVGIIGLRASFPKAPKSATTLLPEFPNSMIDDVVMSAGRSAGQTTEAARGIAKKLGHAKRGGYRSAFDGIAPTQANANRIIRETLAKPSRTFYGDKVIDVYNAAGQGVRFDRTTKKFMGFLEGILATQ